MHPVVPFLLGADAGESGFPWWIVTGLLGLLLGAMAMWAFRSDREESPPTAPMTG